MRPFAERLIAWQRVHGRHDLPWQGTTDAYRIWLSEVMLQQTQVAAVERYFARFVERFPDVRSLADADEDAVLALWSGLGYYSRARNLHRAAREVRDRHAGTFPRDPEALAALPGVGRSTAAAIAAFACGVRAPILDGNVRRVLARWAGVEGWPGAPAVERRLWALAESLLPADDGDPDATIRPYTQGLMDLGATLCTRARPACLHCPVAADCVARRDGRTGVLPTPRPAREVPLRTVSMLVVAHADTVLLTRRPERGVWARLWSVPQRDGHDLEALLAEVHALGVATAGPAEALPRFGHAFTHYRIDVQPWRLQAAEPAPPSAADLRWQPLDALGALGLPQPVRRLLEASVR